MTIKPKWNCPNCPMSSTRHWNVLRHINRWHAGLGRPVSNYARQYRTDEDYEEIIKDCKARKRDYEYEMNVIPVNFSMEHKSMLGNVKMLMERDGLCCY